MSQVEVRNMAATERKLKKGGAFTQTLPGVFDLFRVGLGPSSSHTVGPMRAAADFLNWANEAGVLSEADRISCDLFGALAMTGRGHATDVAVVAGLAGHIPETIDPDAVPVIFDEVRTTGRIMALAKHRLFFDPDTDIVFRFNEYLSAHPNALSFTLWRDQASLAARTYYSVGGGFIQAEGGGGNTQKMPTALPFNFRSAAELLEMARHSNLTIVEIARENERSQRTDAEINKGLDDIWSAMKKCVERGISGEGILPGGLFVKRRAKALYQSLRKRDAFDQGDPLRAMDWVNLYALAVNEENAAGGRVVTAPTNGAAGIVPAVLHYYERFVSGASADGIRSFLLAAAAIGAIIKRNASISGADVGCQGEVGSASAMAAAGLAAAMGGSNEQIENAAEIALEHNLGLTCDPVGGLVQVPCIERNAVASVKAINATRLTRLAARFAAKEAVLKVLGGLQDGISLTEIVVASNSSGKPHLTLSGGALTAAQAAHIDSWMVSLDSALLRDWEGTLVDVFFDFGERDEDIAKFGAPILWHLHPNELGRIFLTPVPTDIFVRAFQEGMQLPRVVVRSNPAPPISAMLPGRYLWQQARRRRRF